MIDAFTTGFCSLFVGRDDALGLGKGGVVKPGSGILADSTSVNAGAYNAHVNGHTPIGIFPLRDDGTVRFAAIDLDEPNFDLARDFQLFLPGKTWIERSRSGNAHVWAFFSEDCPAWIARGLMKHATESLDRPDVEIFPKQDALLDGMVGNYINLPCFGVDEKTDRVLERPMLNDNLEAIPYHVFCSAAIEHRIDPDSWRRRCDALGIVPPAEREESQAEFGQQPLLHECAKHIIANKDTNPVRPGHRAAVLFHLSVQLLNYRDLSEEEARMLVDEVNEAGTDPVPEREVARIFRNAASGRYTFTGCDDPLMRPYVRPDCPFLEG
jgi:hypothetical protein